MSLVEGIYDFAYRGQMAEQALDPEDIERVGMNIRDWVRQVGA